jgi:hypothetical protein
MFQAKESEWGSASALALGSGKERVRAWDSVLER